MTSEAQAKHGVTAGSGKKVLFPGRLPSLTRRLPCGMNGDDPKRLLNAVHFNRLVAPVPLVGFHHLPSTAVGPVHRVLEQSQSVRVVENLEEKRTVRPHTEVGRDVWRLNTDDASS